MTRQEGEFAVVVGGASEKQAQEGRSVLLRWLLFYLACVAAIIGLMWLAPVVPLAPWISDGAALVLGWFLIPFASFVVPIFAIRRTPYIQRKLAWQLLLPLVTGSVLGFVSQAAGEDAALKERGRWVEAKVVAVENDNSNKTRQCTLQKPNGQEIAPDLKESDGCEDGVGRGEVLRVRYDPKGVASPEESWEPGSYAVMIAILSTLFVAFGTWGCMRMSRGDRE
ncbi:hypothetical protein [Streptomyces sp. NPDC093591]|uniref:hypothetical protein n=1 Tax=Streptomyces sp. NPDC093591 TaxID=3366044 RepID=UPI00380E385A